MAKGPNQRLRAAQRMLESGQISQADFNELIQLELDRAEGLREGDPNRSNRIYDALQKAGIDPQTFDPTTYNIDPGTGGTGDGGTGGTGGSGDSGDGGRDYAGETDVEDVLRTLISDPEIRRLLSGEGGATAIMAAALQDSIMGRAAGVSEMDRARAEFDQSSLVQGLEGQAAGLLESPDLFSDEDVAKLLSAGAAETAKSYQNQTAALQQALGIRDIDPSSGVAQELGAQARFQALQTNAMNRINTQMQVKQLNRGAIEDAIKMGLGVSGFTSGVRNQYTSNIANLLAGQPLAQIGPEAAAVAMALGADTGGNGLGGAIQGAMSGGSTGAAVGGPIGAGVGGIAGGLLGYLGER